jgi:hypothetical protein
MPTYSVGLPDQVGGSVGEAIIAGDQIRCLTAVDGGPPARLDRWLPDVGSDEPTSIRYGHCRYPTEIAFDGRRQPVEFAREE